ncbi:MAG: tetratricopeptide repeat protein, partial [Muribaculaceae bacterium]|nr:tetratricopeptide repeat protein [Muribaculaceae bacterium]
DDWRRRNKATFSTSDFDEDTDMDTDSVSFAEGSDSTGVKQKEAENPANPEYYLVQIPTTEEEIAVCNSIIQEGLYNMGVILKDKLEDFPAAISQFDRLLREFPDNEYRLDTYYNLYLIYMRTGEPLRAEEYRKLILYHFPESNYGLAMRDPDYLEKLRHMDEDQETMYAAAYRNYLENNNNAVHDAYEEIMDKYPLSKIVPKFMFIDALSYLTDKNYDKFKEVLREMLERYPDTDITPTASSILSQIAKGRKLEGGTSNVRGMIWDMRLSNDSLAALSDSTGLTPFEVAKDTPQYFVIAFDADSTSVNELLFQVARHNFTSFVVRDFDIEPMTFGRLGLIVVKGFANFEELGHYRKVFEADEALKLPADARIVMISENNFNILLHEGRSLEEYFRFEEEAQADKVEEEALGVTYTDSPAEVPENVSEPEADTGDDTDDNAEIETNE